jgi:hypothetical protein
MLRIVAQGPEEDSLGNSPPRVVASSPTQVVAPAVPEASPWISDSRLMRAVNQDLGSPASDRGLGLGYQVDINQDLGSPASDRGLGLGYQVDINQDLGSPASRFSVAAEDGLTSVPVPLVDDLGYVSSAGSSPVSDSQRPPATSAPRTNLPDTEEESAVSNTPNPTQLNPDLAQLNPDLAQAASGRKDGGVAQEDSPTTVKVRRLVNEEMTKRLPMHTTSSHISVPVSSGSVTAPASASTAASSSGQRRKIECDQIGGGTVSNLAAIERELSRVISSTSQASRLTVPAAKLRSSGSLSSLPGRRKQFVDSETDRVSRIMMATFQR